jgi:hypothetical protein
MTLLPAEAPPGAPAPNLGVQEPKVQDVMESPVLVGTGPF